MTQVFDLFFDFIADLFNTLSSVTFDIYGVADVSLTDIILACIILMFAISVFWKGARA